MGTNETTGWGRRVPCSSSSLAAGVTTTQVIQGVGGYRRCD
jgi:hypothetical protein